MNNLIAMFWAWSANHDSFPWTERVSSTANWADSICRFDFERAKRNGWEEIKVNLDGVLRVF